MIIKSMKCKSNLKPNSTQIVKKLKRLITFKSEPPNLRNNLKMYNANLSSQDKLTLYLTKN